MFNIYPAVKKIGPAVCDYSFVQFFIFCLQESVGDLMIRNIQLGHSGKYLCTVQTTLERLSAVADIIVRGEQK